MRRPLHELQRFLRELKRRNVYRVGASYVVVAFVGLQAVNLLIPATTLPTWADELLIALALFGFPIALVLAWAFELTPEGLRQTGARPPRPERAEEDGTDARASGRVRRRLDYTIGIGVLLVAVLIAWYGIPTWNGGDEGAGKRTPDSVAEASAGTRTPSRSIAVLPFADLSPEGDQEYFAHGIAEEVLNVLARMPGLKVAGRTSSFQFTGPDYDVPTIGERLGVTHLLAGAVRKQGDRVRITTQLVEAADGFQLWSETFDRDLTDVFAIQDQIARAVARELAVRLDTAESVPVMGTSNPTAHELYLRARQSLATRDSEALVEAATLFGAAVILDSSYSAAYSGRARALSLKWVYSESGRLDSMTVEEAKSAAERALEFNPDNPEALSVLAYLDDLFFWNWDRAAERMSRALALAPNDAEIANFGGDHFGARRNVEQMLAWERKAVSLNPLHAVNHVDLGWTLMSLERCGEALDRARDALLIDSEFPPALDLHATSSICLGRFASARRYIDRLASAGGEATAALNEAHLGAATGDTGLIDRAGERVTELVEGGRAPYYFAALTAALGGDMQAAGSWLDRAYQMREVWLVRDYDHLVPEDWPDHPAIQEVLDRRELNELWEIRRRNLAAWRATESEERIGSR